ncbi:autotransporter outer membrane beta-barrel domain-containing protein [Stenotrophomonas maltophilia]|uniref:autotransporter family protein n=1 Tax=Stenotrophomonas maltophilia TaxID=40324 RepID=UPI0019D4704E|nr:autotransporter outer membrane beta-barrel domain-containing protein [Stenotrophomonas maltophilia]MBN7829421.1 autotransporter outer membrane beta-barrel domain-containing protein [Stenotrophomonas maltophilia]MBN7832675.1 autotransporter outer membrane beta-barrel domain-containing protein [Stenotrophomonas maltophilia]MBN7859946.1 autotransporter outer membrane beta-barrel domain-containing protein [Stenotrophomonas maltophilia]MBN7919428.1 autotransporter outer membrane beta-barrel domai
MKIAVRRSLALAIAAGLAVAGPSQAGVLNPGESATVNAGDPVESWSLDNASLVVAAGGATQAVDASDGSTVTFDSAAINASSAIGIRLGNSAMTMNDSTVVNTTGRALALTGQIGSALPGSSATLTRSTLSGSGIGASVQLGGDLVLDATHLEGHAQAATGVYSGTGLFLVGTGQIVARNGSTITGDGNGIWAQYDFTPVAGEAVTVDIDASRVEGRTGSGIYIEEKFDPADAAVVARFNFRNGAELVGGDGNLLRVDATDADIDLNVENSRMNGNIVNAGGSTVNVALSNGASITGTMSNVTRVALDSSTWNLTGNSSVGTLSLGNGTVALGDGSAFHTLNVAGNFSGADGMIIFNTVLAGDDAATDKLIIGGDTSGSANVRVNNVGGAGAQTDKGIELIHVGGASNGQFNLSGRAVGGQYEYFLHKGTGADGNWYLRSQLPTVPDPCEANPGLPQCPPVDPVDPVDPVHPVDPEPVLRPEPGAYLANLQAAQTMFRLGYHDRNAGQNAGRAWARVDGSRTGFDAISRQLDIRGNSQALTVGADLWRHDSGSSVGVMLSSGNASSTSTNELTGYYARGKVKGEALGLYGTWRGGNGVDPYAGFYVDGSLQRAQFRNRVEGIGLDAERYDSRAWQGAVETGYAFRVGGASNGGIYLEPQLQVGYSRWDSNRHTEANGTVVSTENANGVFGRAGLRLSGVTRWGNGAAEVQPYLAANWLHTRAESQIRVDDEIADARVPRSRGEFSGGASMKFANGIGAWGGLSLQKASGYHQTSAQVGVSYSW